MCFIFFFNDTATTEIYTLSLHDALPIYHGIASYRWGRPASVQTSLEAAATLLSGHARRRSEEHTSELQSRLHLVCRLLLEKKKNRRSNIRPRAEGGATTPRRTGRSTASA